MPITLGNQSSTALPAATEVDDGPRRRDPEATRKAILDAAEELFTCHGPSATSLNQVAKKAAVTKSLIHHHFGSKEELWQEVQSRYFHDYFEIQKSMLESSDSTAEVLRDSLVAYFQFLRTHPESVRFMTWTFASKEEDHCPIRQEEELFELGIEKIKESQAKGEIRADLEPFFIIKTLIALPFQWFLTRDETLALIDDGVDADQLDEMYLRDMVEMFLHGVQPRPDEAPGSAIG